MNLKNKLQKILFFPLSVFQKRKKKIGVDLDLKILRKSRGKKIPGLRQIFHIRKLISPRERLLLRISFLVFFLGLFSFLFVFLSRYRVAVPAVGGTYIEGVVGGPQLINPIFASLNEVDTDLTMLLFSGLLAFDEKQQIVHGLAESYSISEDGKKYTVHLKKNVVWHDGNPFTAKDVLFTFESIQNPIVGSPLMTTFQNVQLEMIDDYTVVFVLRDPYVYFLHTLTFGILPEHVWFDVSPENMKLSAKNMQPVGTGPFVFKKIIKQDTGRIVRVELTGNKNYFNEPPYIKDFVFEFFTEYDGADGAIQALREQKIQGLRFLPSDLREKAKRKHVVFHSFSLPQHTSIFLNMQKKGILDDLDVRKALLYAIDKQKISDMVGGEGTSLIASPILKDMPGFDESLLASSTYNMDEANRLLEQNWKRITVEEYRKLRSEALTKEFEREAAETAASSTASVSTSTSSTTSTDLTTSSSSTVVTTSIDAPENEQRESVEKKLTIEEKVNQVLDAEFDQTQLFYRKNKDGRILEITITTVDLYEYHLVSEYVAGFWKEAGIKTWVQYVQPKDLVREVLRKGDYDMFLYSVLLGKDPDQYQFWHSSQIVYPGLNLSHYVNEKTDELLKKSRIAVNMNELSTLYGELQKNIINDVPAIFLYQSSYMYATTDAVSDIVTERVAHPSDRFSSVCRWYVKTKTAWNFR